MRFAWLVIWLVVTSAQAQETHVPLYFASVFTPQRNPDAPFFDVNIAFNDLAYIRSSGGYHQFADDSPNVAAFIAKLTDGVTDTITISSAAFSYSFPENYFFTENIAPPLVGFPYNTIALAGRNDLHGLPIDRVGVSQGWQIRSGTRYQQYAFEVWARVPEPSTMLLLVALAAVRCLYCRSR